MSTKRSAATAPDDSPVAVGAAPDAASDRPPYTLQPVTFGRKRRKTSWVWDHFESTGGAGGTGRNVCRHCLRILSDASATVSDATSYPPTTGNSTLAMHLHTKHGITRESEALIAQLKSGEEQAAAPGYGAAAPASPAVEVGAAVPSAAAVSSWKETPSPARRSSDVDRRVLTSAEEETETTPGEEVGRLAPVADADEDEDEDDEPEEREAAALEVDTEEDIASFHSPKRSRLSTGRSSSHSSVQPTTSAPSKARILQSLLDFAADERRGLAFLSSGSFRALCSTLNPSVELPSFDEMKSLADAQLREEEQRLLRATLEIPGSVALTLDRRSAPGYVVVTLHWILSDWEQQRRLLEFMRAPPASRSEWAIEVAERTIAALRRFGVLGRVRAVTTDVGSEMAAVVERVRHTVNAEFGLQLGDAMHLRCAAQLLEQCVFAALSDIDRPLATLRALLRLRDRRKSAMDTVGSVARVDTGNNWDALFAMIDAADEAKDGLHAPTGHVVPARSGAGAPARLHANSEEMSAPDWRTLKSVKDFLEGAVGYALVSEDNDYTGASLLPLIYDSLYAHCANACDGHEPVSGEAPTLHARSAVTAFLNTLKEHEAMFWNSSANLAQILDPRVSNASAEAAAMKDWIRQRLVADYGLTQKRSAAGAVSLSTASSSSAPPSSARMSLDASKPERPILSLFAAARQARNEVHERVVEDEVDAFYKLTAEPDLDCADVLGWWRVVGSQRFPKLSLLARDTLMIPGSATPIREFVGRARADEPPALGSLGDGSSDTTPETVAKVHAWRQIK